MTFVSHDGAFTARDVQEMAGLTGRQLNDWDGRGALPHTREGTGWRRFSNGQLFTVMVGTALRRQFGVSVERLKNVIEIMNAEVLSTENQDHFTTALVLMATVGGAVWLMTDFEDEFVMDSEIEFAEMWRNGDFGGDDGPSAFAFLKVNPIVNTILGSMDPAGHIPADERDVLKQYRSAFGMNSAEEYEVLQMIRSGEYERIEVVAPNGKIENIKTTKKRNVAELATTKKHPKTGQSGATSS